MLSCSLLLVLACGGNDPSSSEDGRALSDAGMLLDGATETDLDQGSSDNADSGESIERSVNSVLPNRVPRTGDVSIRIIGLGFSDDMTLTIGSVRCQQLELQSETQATCVVPEMTLGRKNLIMRWTATGHVRELRDAIEVFEPLRITDLQPERGHVSGGQLVWMGGAGRAHAPGLAPHGAATGGVDAAAATPTPHTHAADVAAVGGDIGATT